ncbi:Hypothetical predicted protein [Mytilus galloprovincialis]|uniref:Uncharacterized protein n=1 Tax=Mytilus galloprovincialis TaxID=29158 RepID=A0A8B6FEX6_MYTGA|nr:Hypothetical predicted protein [Mytilus galloprovincialis]
MDLSMEVSSELEKMPNLRWVDYRKIPCLNCTIDLDSGSGAGGPYIIGGSGAGGPFITGGRRAGGLLITGGSGAGGPLITGGSGAGGAFITVVGFAYHHTCVEVFYRIDK